MASTSFICTISGLFIPSCLRAEDSSPLRPAQRQTRQVVCNQYGRRLYMRPIMPPTTRRQSRLKDNNTPLSQDVFDEDNRGRTVSRKNSIGRTDSVQVEEVLERKQSNGTFYAQLPQRERREEVRADEDGEVKGLKERTLSMEMSDAIEALHRDEEEVEAPGPDVLEIVDTRDDDGEDEDEQDAKDLDEDVSDEINDDSSPPTPTPQRSPSQLSSPGRIAIVGADPTHRPDLYPRATTVPVARIVAPAVLREPPPDPWVMYYDCARGCLEPIRIVQGEPLRCRECGVWMVLKKRTKRICYFEAR